MIGLGLKFDVDRIQEGAASKYELVVNLVHNRDRLED